jgi:hypothetical protein
MNGTFNGIRLKQITWLITTPGTAGSKRVTFRAPGSMPKLERALQLNLPGLLILSSDTIEGRIVRYVADVHFGYEITIEIKE